MTVSRTLSFVVGLLLAGLIAFAALGEDIQMMQDLTKIAGSALNQPLTGAGSSERGVPAPFAVDLSNPNAPALIQMHDIAVRLYRIETLLREMCAKTARFSGCGELRQQQ